MTVLKDKEGPLCSVVGSFWPTTGRPEVEAGVLRFRSCDDNGRVVIMCGPAEIFRWAFAATWARLRLNWSFAVACARFWWSRAVALVRPKDADNTYSPTKEERRRLSEAITNWVKTGRAS